MATIIRQGRPDDAAFIAQIVLLSQRGPRPLGWFDFALDQAEPQVRDFLTRLAVAKPRSWYHVSQFLIAEVDSEPAAALCAMPSRETRDTMRSAIAEVALATGMSAADIFARGSYARGCWVQGGEDEWLIEHVAAIPAYRGRGLVQALIEHALAAGRRAGFERASISFLIGNEAAERSYAKAGFCFAEEKRDPAFEALTGSPGFRRFVRAI